MKRLFVGFLAAMLAITAFVATLLCFYQAIYGEPTDYFDQSWLVLSLEGVAGLFVSGTAILVVKGFWDGEIYPSKKLSSESFDTLMASRCR